MEEKLIRCFICLELPREAIEEIECIQGLIKKKNLFYGKMTEPENLHLTLKFLGEISEDRVKEINEKLSGIKEAEFEANLGDLGSFNSRILWIKLNGKGVFDLQNKIDENLKDFFKKEERFMSHITLARIKKIPNPRAFLEYVKNLKHRPIKFKVKGFFLKKSELKPEGPVYENIGEYKLE